ncbi:MAG: U32 family peptidase [Fibrobacter sp.]|nr:U32 family peptidase [Fibrobacter sp.]
MNKPELLLPVGTREMLEAAIHNGADAVYFGVPHWNARGRTEDFSFEDVGEMIRYARIRGVRTFLAMNVLVFERELQSLPEFVEKIIALEPDAFIIQDIGLARLIRAIAPNQEIHASTQMTLASAEAVNLASQLGFNRAVLARELSLKQIAAIKEATPLELEVFIHGALCVSYSGQCLTSENFGGRSANRGQCAQSCRLPYRIFVDGKEFTKTDAQYLFSTRDLCAIPRIDDLSEIGVNSLKVEGRLKSPEYVAAVSRAYRKALDFHNGTHSDVILDHAQRGRGSIQSNGNLMDPVRGQSPLQDDSNYKRGQDDSNYKRGQDDSNKRSQKDGNYMRGQGDGLCASDMEPLQVLFSRGLGTGWLDGVNHQELVDGTFSNHHGEFLGTVRRIDRSGISVTREFAEGEEPGDFAPPRPGDGILFENPEFGVSIGGRLYGVQQIGSGSDLRLEFGRELNQSQIALGMKVYRNDSPTLEKELRHSFTDRELAKRIPVNMVLFGKIGEPLRLTVYDNDGHKVQIESETAIEAARNAATSRVAETARKELAALSSSAYVLQSLDIQVDASAFIPGKVLRTLRQNAVAELDKERCRWKELNPNATQGRAFLDKIRSDSGKAAKRPEISILVRNPQQIEALAGLDIDNVVMDFDWGVKYDESLAQIREYGFKAGMATLRIHKPGENHYLKNILRLSPDFALVRSLGALAILRENGIPLKGDYSLNAANSASYDWLLNLGLDTLHPSWDLNSTQLFDLLQNIDGRRMEIALHQYMPAFHSEYCAFARALTTGRRFPECGKICTQHKVEILDHKGERHFLQSDAECRNTLFVGKPQSALKLLPRLQQAGVNSFRIELLDETPDAVRRKVQTYTQAIRGKIEIETAIRLAGVQEKYGLSEGQLFNESTWQDRKK